MGDSPKKLESDFIIIVTVSFYCVWQWLCGSDLRWQTVRKWHQSIPNAKCGKATVAVAVCVLNPIIQLSKHPSAINQFKTLIFVYIY
jgi:hypothetical protein